MNSFQLRSHDQMVERGLKTKEMRDWMEHGVSKDLKCLTQLQIMFRARLTPDNRLERLDDSRATAGD